MRPVRRLQPKRSENSPLGAAAVGGPHFAKVLLRAPAAVETGRGLSSNLPNLPPSAAGPPLKAASAPQNRASDDPGPAFDGFVFSARRPADHARLFALTLNVDSRCLSARSATGIPVTQSCTIFARARCRNARTARDKIGAVQSAALVAAAGGVARRRGQGR
jgi:hypothetical protein